MQDMNVKGFPTNKKKNQKQKGWPREWRNPAWQEARNAQGWNAGSVRLHFHSVLHCWRWPLPVGPSAFSSCRPALKSCSFVNENPERHQWASAPAVGRRVAGSHNAMVTGFEATKKKGKLPRNAKLLIKLALCLGIPIPISDFWFLIFDFWLEFPIRHPLLFFHWPQNISALPSQFLAFLPSMMIWLVMFSAYSQVNTAWTWIGDFLLEFYVCFCRLIKNGKIFKREFNRKSKGGGLHQETSLTF